MVATLMLIKLWIPISAAMPAQMILPPVSFAFMPIKMQSITINNIKIIDDTTTHKSQFFSDNCKNKVCLRLRNEISVYRRRRVTVVAFSG